MTENEKQLLIKDLCARLPYSIWGLHRGEDLPLYAIDDSGAYMVLGYDAWFDLDTVPFIPYLRPLSSMTEEEAKELIGEHLKDEKLFAECLAKAANGDDSMRGKVIPHFAADWCDKNHFDYRGLIEKGLALEAPEGMYK